MLLEFLSDDRISISEIALEDPNPNSLMRARVASISMAVALFHLQLRQLSAVKSTITGCPSRRACSTAAALHFCHSNPLTLRPAGVRQSN